MGKKKREKKRQRGAFMTTMAALTTATRVHRRAPGSRPSPRLAWDPLRAFSRGSSTTTNALSSKTTTTRMRMGIRLFPGNTAKESRGLILALRPKKEERKSRNKKISRRSRPVLKEARALHEPDEVAELAGIFSSLDTSGQIQLVYVGVLLGLLSGAVFLVLRQVLYRTKLEEATKDLSEKARTGDATYDEYYELGVLLIRKKLFATALKHLDSAKRSWEGDEEGLAQLYNAMGYAYLQQDKLDSAVAEYLEAVNLRPRYVVAWNNLGDAYKKMKKYEDALEAYETTLGVDPDNKVAKEQFNFLKSRVNRLSL